MSNPTAETPQHEPENYSCVFLGRFEEYDLYFKENTFEVTLIARWGTSWRYSSGLCFSKPYESLAGPQPGMPALVEARKRAFDAGYGPAIEEAESKGL